MSPGTVDILPLTADTAAMEACVGRTGAIVVTGVEVEEDDALLKLVARFAAPSHEGNGGGPIYEVTPAPDGAEVSRTAAAFPLHTDSTFMPRPHGLVALGCVRAEPGAGGDSLVLTADAVADRLPPDALEALREPAFWFLGRDAAGRPTPCAWPVLSGPAERPTVRYRADALTRGELAAERPLGERHRAALDAFERVVADPELPLRHALRPGEVLLVDNHRVLHGRTVIADGADRLLRRVKADG